MSQQESFRFVQLMSPRRQQALRIELALRMTPFARQVLDTIATGVGGGDIRSLAREFVARENFNDDPADLNLAAPAQRLIARLRENGNDSAPDYGELISNVFGRAPAALVESSDFGAFRDAVSDRLVALKMVSDRQPGALAVYADLQRAISIVVRAAADENSLSGVSPRRLLITTIELPEEIFPLPRDVVPPVEAAVDETSQQIARLTTELDELERAADEIVLLGARDLEAVGPQSATQVGEVVESGRVAAAFMPLRDVNAILGGPAQDFEDDSMVQIRRTSIESLSAPTQRMLDAVAAASQPSSIGALIDGLERRASAVAAELAALTEPPEPAQFMQIGTTTLPSNIPAFPPTSSLANPPHPGVPTSVGQIRPTHIGRLRKTKQHILRYEAEEIAHVENVVIGETKKRETRRLTRTEETVTREEETIREEERDLQTTDRQEFQRETQETLKQSQQFKIGASISASYGPVEVSVDTEFSTETSLETINRTSSNFAREVLEKTAQRISERVREEQTVRTLQEFEELNEHGFENTTEEHISAMFQWLTKVYYARVYEYGERLWTNVTVPEPQYFLVNTLKKQKGPLEGLTKPDPVDFGPEHVKPGNYMKYVKKYQVDGVKPPPPRKKVISKVFRYPESAAPQTEPAPEEFTDSLEVGIEPGYKAVSAYLIYTSGKPQHGAGPHPNDVLTGVSVFVGESITSFVSDQSGVIKGNYEKSLSDETGSIMIGLHARNIGSYVLGIQITLLRTGRALDDWRLETYDAIVGRYQALLADHRERKAELETRAGIEIPGRNPLENRLLERTELTRTALSMLTGQHFEEFDAIEGFMEGRIDFEEAIPEGRYARFFMNCFEWENMTYQFYPYFWGRRSTWKEKLLLQDTDPLHAEFLKCGYADMQIPVRPGFEAALMHWLDTGTIWQGADPPEITNPRYALFLDELRRLREDEDPHREVAKGEPWEVSLPTTLVRIRPGNSLPVWQHNEETEEFLPVPEPT